MGVSNLEVTLKKYRVILSRALALGGEEGVRDVLRNFMTDFELTMGLAGCKNISEINTSCLVN